MKTAMKFQNKSPEEIVRRYRRNVRLKQGLVILALLAYTAFAIREIWWNDVSFLGLLLGELLVFLALTPVGVWIAWDFLALNAILNINCDPVTYAQVMHLLGQKRNRKRSAITIQINEAIGDMWTGRFSEALSLVKSLPDLYDCTVLISSHMLSEIELMADDIGILNHGRLLFEGSLDELRQRALHSGFAADNLEDMFLSMVEKDNAVRKQRADL